MFKKQQLLDGFLSGVVSSLGTQGTLPDISQL
jgi:hypothetical protein